jgi:hypothetical protein
MSPWLPTIHWADRIGTASPAHGQSCGGLTVLARHSGSDRPAVAAGFKPVGDLVVGDEDALTGQRCGLPLQQK